MHPERIGSPCLIAFNEGNTTRYLKKVKEVAGKARAATGKGSVEGGARADCMESNALQLSKGVWRTLHEPTAWRDTRVEVARRKKVVG
jgi:hypothetical protein